MTMSVSAATDGDPMVELNTTPLIDVMMVLLILFIVTLPLRTNITKLDLPQVPGPETKREVIALTVDFDGTILWNGAVIDDLAQLERHFAREAAKAAQPELHVRPDKRAGYDRVVRVLALAQRNGLRRIGVVAAE
jgi:biopolymer transport protein ExbD